MTPFRTLARSALVAALVAASGSANAGWDNVFQVCCNGCKSTTTTAASPVVAEPQQPCTTRYVQRSYYQPVTTYQTRTVVEPVTSYRTSYYYEPVTSYRVSTYYDPGSCGYQQVTTPEVSYRLRSQTCPVTSYYQRAVVQAVPGYQVAYYLEPQTTCCQTTIGAPVGLPPGAVPMPSGPPAVGPAPVGVAVPANPAGPPPSVGEQRQAPLAVPPGVSEQRDNSPPGVSESQRYAAPPSSLPMPKAPETSFRPTSPNPPSVRLDRIVSASAPVLQGQIVNEEHKPLPNVQLLFILSDKLSTRESVKADAAGKFEVTLTEGSWLVYTQSPDGRTDFRRKIEVRADQPAELRLVSR